MGKSLSEIVNAALQGADSGIKMASASDAESEPDFADFMAGLGLETPAAEEPAAAEPEKISTDTAAVFSDAEYARKLASALEISANLVTEKLARSPLNAPGPAVYASQHMEATIHPKAVTTSVPGPQKSHGGGGNEKTMGMPNGIETNKADYSSPNWTKNKEAALGVLRAKLAQADQLTLSGQEAMAQKLYAEVEEQGAKLAQDPTSPQPSMPSKSESYRMDTEPGPASRIPDNNGMVSMTRASARDPSTREAKEFFLEPPKKDNAVLAHVGRTDGLKISGATPVKFAADLPPFMKKKEGDDKDDKPVESSKKDSKEPEDEKAEKKAALSPEKLAAARELLKKTAARVNDPNATPAERQKAAGIIAAVRQKTGKDPLELLS